MSLYLQGEIWWYEFTIEDQRYRSSTRTGDKELASRVEAEHHRTLKRGGVRLSPTLDAIRAEESNMRRAKRWEGVETCSPPPEAVLQRLTSQEFTPNTLLREAGECFIAILRDKRREKTLECADGNLRRLTEFFGNIPLKQFTIAHFEHYQSVRGAKCSTSTVNHELNLLSRILRRVDLWWQIKRNYTPLKEKAWKAPRIFTVDEQERIFRALKVNPNLELADIALTITRNTTASGCELRGLRISSLELEADPPRIHIPPDSTKNNTRPRTIPLNVDALRACKLALERAKGMGSHYPNDYLFPFRVNRRLWNPRKQASNGWLRKQIDILREVTGIDHINPHTFRHLAVTELLEQGAPEDTVIALAGWVGRRMVETYSHARIEAKADAVELLSGFGTRPPTRREPKLPPPPVFQHPEAQPPQQTVDLMNSAIQAEIARQVDMALQREREQYVSALDPVQAPAKGARLIRFPGAG
jgi:integrase